MSLGICLIVSLVLAGDAVGVSRQVTTVHLQPELGFVRGLRPYLNPNPNPNPRTRPLKPNP